MQNQEEKNPDLLSTPTRSWAERNGFPGWLIGGGWALLALAGFQVVAGIVAVVLLFATGRISFEGFDPASLTQHLDILFIGNSAGQILFLGLLTWVVTKGSTQKNQRVAFLRLNRPAFFGQNALLVVALLISVQPIIYFLSWVNLQLPFSEGYLQFEEVQIKLLSDFLQSDHLLYVTIFHVAVVPAFCEELMFRGYILRNFEKSMLPWVAIVISGIIFGLFHIRFTQLIPLSVLGMLLAWITIETRSIWPAVIAHFVNNAGSVMFATLYPEIAFDESLRQSYPPLELVISSIFLSGFLVYLIYRINNKSEPETYVQRFET